MKFKTLIFLMTTSLAFIVIEAAPREIENSPGTQETSELLTSSALNEQQDREYGESNEGRSDIDGTKMIFEKKYFDILPNDLYSDEETGDVSLKTSKGEIENLPHLYEADDPLESAGRHVNSRFRRDLTNSDGRQKRQNYFFQPYPLTHHASSYPRYNVDFYFPQEPAYIHQPYQNIIRRRDPYYSQQQYFVPPQQQFRPNVYPTYNQPIQPQANPNPFHSSNTNRLLPPGNSYLPPTANVESPVDNPKEDVNNRIFGFEEPENRPIWASQFVPNHYQNNNHHSAGASGGSVTQNFRPVENNNIGDGGMNRNPFGEASDEFEADAPLSVFEDLDIELTTRAPLTTKKPDLTIEGINKNPNRNANRKPKPRN